MRSIFCKRVLTLALGLLACAGVFSALAFDGSGSASDPWKINTAADLIELAKKTSYDGSKHYLLTSDVSVDISELKGDTKYFGIGGYASDGAFLGTFDGGGHTVTLSGTASFSSAVSAPAIGLFAKIESTGQTALVKNIKTAGSFDVNITNIEGSVYIGGLAGTVQFGASAENCVNGASVTMTGYSSIPLYFGGVTGYVDGAALKGCRNSGAVQMNAQGVGYKICVGGIAGCAYSNTTLEVCANLAKVSIGSEVLASGGVYLGGLAGLFDSGSAVNCFNRGEISANLTGVSRNSYIGGLVGQGKGSLANCYNNGVVKRVGGDATAYVGGLYGAFGTFSGNPADNEFVRNCYNTAPVLYESSNASINHITGMGTVQSTFIPAMSGSSSQELELSGFDHAYWKKSDKDDSAQRGFRDNSNANITDREKGWFSMLIGALTGGDHTLSREEPHTNPTDTEIEQEGLTGLLAALESFRNRSSLSGGYLPWAHIAGVNEGYPTLTHNVDFSAGEGGSISPSGTVAAEIFSVCSYTVTPNEGYECVSLTHDGTAVATSTNFIAVEKADHKVAADFAKKKFDITASARANGTLNADKTPLTGVEYGTTIVFTAAPASGYRVASFKVDGAEQTLTNNQYTLTVKKAHTVSVEFTNICVVTPSVNNSAWGTISPAEAQNVLIGGSHTFTAAPNGEAYKFLHFLVDSTTQVSENPYVFTPQNAKHSIMAVFGQKDRHTITVIQPTGGSISPAEAQSVIDGGESAEFTAAANEGYEFTGFVVDGSAVSGSTYKFTNVTGDHTITATFTPKAAEAFTITASAGAGGSITPSGSITVAKGAGASFTAAAGSGYEFAGFTVDGAESTANPYVFTNVQAPHSISAAFRATQSTGGGSDTPPVVIDLKKIDTKPTPSQAVRAFEKLVKTDSKLKVYTSGVNAVLKTAGGAITLEKGFDYKMLQAAGITQVAIEFPDVGIILPVEELAKVSEDFELSAVKDGDEYVITCSDKDFELTLEVEAESSGSAESVVVQRFDEATNKWVTVDAKITIIIKGGKRVISCAGLTDGRYRFA